MKKVLVLAAIFFASVLRAQKLLTPYEKSGQKQTATYAECLQYYGQLSKRFMTVHLRSFDTTDGGHPLQLVLFSQDKQFDPRRWHAQQKVVILVNNGIHPGEPDGIDASMQLLRDMALGTLPAPANVVLAIVPVYNIGGSLNRGLSRVNQNGPESYGFRGNAQNLDLNRDFIKCDSRDAQAFTRLFQWLQPDILVDNHVSDGADYQHTMTLLTTQHDKLGGLQDSFLHRVFEPALYKGMQEKKWAMCPYVNFEEGNPAQGWVAFYDPPRYSSGYATLFQTLAFVPETHMLKPYPQRVQSTYDLMRTVVQQASTQSAAILRTRALAVEAVKKQIVFPLAWQPDTTQYGYIAFKGYTTGTKTSEVTGMPRLYYDHTRPFEQQVKYYHRYRPSVTVTKPLAYIIPAGWHAVTNLLRLNGVAMQRLAQDTVLHVEYYRIEAYKSQARVFEKHHRNTDTRLSTHRTAQRFLKGDYLVYTGQRTDRYLVETLEPLGDDSFFSWNFFDAILQQKENYSDYRWEDAAGPYLQAHPELRQQLEERKKTDSSFAASATAQLDFVFKHSPWYEAAHLRYPVYRLVQ